MKAADFVDKIVEISKCGPSGPYRPCDTLRKRITEEIHELHDALDVDDIVGALEEAGDVFYYSALGSVNECRFAPMHPGYAISSKKVYARLADLTGVRGHDLIDLIMRVAIEKYTLRFIENKQKKDKAQEHALIMNLLEEARAR